MSIHVGDSGGAVVLNIFDETENRADISSATEKLMYLRDPRGAIYIRPADFVTDGKDGKLQSVFAAGDILVDGTWYFQGKVSMPAMPSGTWHTDVETFEVQSNLV